MSGSKARWLALYDRVLELHCRDRLLKLAFDEAALGNLVRPASDTVEASAGLRAKDEIPIPDPSVWERLHSFQSDMQEVLSLERQARLQHIAADRTQPREAGMEVRGVDGNPGALAAALVDYVRRSDAVQTAEPPGLRREHTVSARALAQMKRTLYSTHLPTFVTVVEELLAEAASFSRVPSWLRLVVAFDDRVWAVEKVQSELDARASILQYFVKRI